MPPKKSSSAVSTPRRTPRTTVRKSTSKSTNVHADTPPTTATQSSPSLSSAKPTSLLTSPTDQITPKSIKTLKSETTKTSPAEPSAKFLENDLSEAQAIQEDNVSKSDSESVGVTVLAETSSRVGDESIGKVDETLVEKTPESVAENKGDKNVQEGGRTRRTVVKKTVRVVKKVVKKRVPKRVAKNQGGSASEESEMLEATNSGDRDDVLGDAGVKDSNAIESVSMEVENADSNGSASKEIGDSRANVTVSDGTVCVEVENQESEVCEAPVLDFVGDEKKGDEGEMNVFVAELEDKNVAVVENQNVVVVEGQNVVMVEDKNDEYKAGKLNLGGGQVKEEVGKMDVAEGQNEAMVEDQNDEYKAEKLTSGDGQVKEGLKEEVGNMDVVDVAEGQNVATVEDQNDEYKAEKLNSGDGQVKEGVKEEVGNMDVVVEQNVAMVGDQNYEYTAEKLNSDSGFKEGLKEEVGNSEVGGSKTEVRLSDGVLLSGEMEALERRRRRKTQIFIGGLDKDAKEEDIRKIFEEVGEVTEVSVVMNSKTGKNKGFAFVRYASASDAKSALAKHRKVEICGKQCGVSPVEGNDTIFLGNIEKKWKSEDVIKMLQDISIEKIDQVTVVADPNNLELNRGFAFVELETCKDAQIAYNKLQKKDAFGKHLKIKVAWAEPLIEPDEEDMLKVKSVYAEYVPSSWDEKKIKDYFKKFGEIENVALARNLISSRRKDFAFVNYTTREAALACIEAFSHEQLDDGGSKVNVKVSLAKPLPKGKQIKHFANPSSNESSKEKQKAAQPVIKPHEPRNKGKSTSSNYEDIRVDRRSSTNTELVQLLREQASRRQTQSGLSIGSGELGYHYPSSGTKRPFPAVGDNSLYSDIRGYPRPRLESSYPIASRSTVSHSVGSTSLPNYQRQGAGYTSEPFYTAEGYPSYFQTRERAVYHASSGTYRRY